MSKFERDFNRGVWIFAGLVCLIYYTPKVIYLVTTILNLNK